MATVEKQKKEERREEILLPEPELSDEDYARIMLEKAAERIEDGWAQGNYAAWGRVCAVGAIGSVTRHDSFFPRGRKSRIRQIAEGLLAKTLPIYGSDAKQRIVYFNDVPGRTKKEVLFKFRQAASLDRP